MRQALHFEDDMNVSVKRSLYMGMSVQVIALTEESENLRPHTGESLGQCDRPNIYLFSSNTRKPMVQFE